MDGVTKATREALLEASIAFFGERAGWLAEELAEAERRAWVDERILAPLEEANALATRLPADRGAEAVMELAKALWRATFAGAECAPAEEMLR
ncbi:MAG: hypothetical protein QM704_05370 [Anaeromyxobacteraceae bacterium]